MVTDDEVSVEPPAQAAVKLLGAIDVRDGNGGDLELHVDRRASSGRSQFRCRTEVMVVMLVSSGLM